MKIEDMEHTQPEGDERNRKKEFLKAEKLKDLTDLAESGEVGEELGGVKKDPEIPEEELAEKEDLKKWMSDFKDEELKEGEGSGVEEATIKEVEEHKEDPVEHVEEKGLIPVETDVSMEDETPSDGYVSVPMTKEQIKEAQEKLKNWPHMGVDTKNNALEDEVIVGTVDIGDEGVDDVVKPAKTEGGKKEDDVVDGEIVGEVKISAKDTDDKAKPDLKINANFAKRFPSVVEIMKKSRDDITDQDAKVLRGFIRVQGGIETGVRNSNRAVYAEAQGFYRDNARKEPPRIEKYVAPRQPPVEETPPVVDVEENDDMDEVVSDWLKNHDVDGELSSALKAAKYGKLGLKKLEIWFEKNVGVDDVPDDIKTYVSEIHEAATTLSKPPGEERREEGEGESLKEALDMREKLPDSRNSLWMKIYEITEQTLDAKGSGKLLSDESVFQKLGLLEGGIGGFLFPVKIMGEGERELREDEYALEVAKIKAFVSARRKLHDSLQDIKNDLPYGDWLNKLKSADASSSLVTFEVDGSRRIDDYQAFARAEFGEFTNPAKNEVMRLCIGVADLVRARYERERLLQRGAEASDAYMVGLDAREREAERLITDLGLDEDYISDIGGAGFNPARLKRVISTHRFGEGERERAVGETTTDLIWDFLEAHQWRIWTGESPIHSAAYFGEWGDDKDITVAKMLEQQGKRLGDVLPGIMKSGLENLNLEGKDGYELAKRGQFFSSLASNRPENKLVTSPMALSTVQALDGEGLRALFLMDLPGGKGILNQGENVGAWIGSKLKIDMLVGDGVYSKEQAKEILKTALDFSTWLISWENKQYKEGTNLVARAVKIREFIRELNGGGFLDGNFEVEEKREIVSKAEARRAYLLKLAFTTGERNAAYLEKGKSISTSSIKEPKVSIDTRMINRIVGESPYLKKYRKIRGTPKGDKYRDVLTRWGWWEDGFETD